MHRLVFGLALALAILPLATAPSATPSHPLSHINPVDVDLNMSGQRIYNVSNIAIQDGLNITEDGIAPGSYAGVGYDALRWNDTGFRWEVQDANLSLENNELQEYFAGQCDGGEVVSQVYSNGSYNCQSITDSTDDKYVNEAGDTMNGSLNFTDYADYSINNVSYINNFFEDSCSGDNVVTGVEDDGTYNCTSTSTLNPIEDLEETLGEGNSAGNYNINMTGSGITWINSANFSGGIQIDNAAANDAIDIAIGNSAMASGYNGGRSALAVGSETVADAGGSTAVGQGANVSAQGGISIGSDDYVGFNTFEAGPTVEGENGIAIGSGIDSGSRATESIGDNSIAIGSGAQATANNALAFGYSANAPNSYEATFGNLGSEKINLNITGNATIHGQELDLTDGNISNFFDTTCSGDLVVDGVNANGTYDCVDPSTATEVENLSLTLAAGNRANQSINMDENVIGNVSALQDNSINTVEFDGNNDVAIPNGNLDLSNNNISNYWSNNLCGEDRAVKKIHENGTVSCTQQIEFADNVENLSETLVAGNVANQTIFMDGSNLSGPQYVDTVDLDNPGVAINLTGNRYGVATNSIDDSLVADNSLTNDSIDSFSSFTINTLGITNELTGTGIVNSEQIASDAVINGKINDGAVGNNKIAVSSINTTQIQDSEVTGSDIASDSITRTGGQLDSSVAGEGLSYETGSLNVSTDSTLTVSANDLGIADSGVDTVHIAESAVENGEIAFDAVNRSQLAESGCTDNEVLEWTGSEWTCSQVDDLGTDDQNLTVFNNTNGEDDTIQIEDGNNITVEDNVADGDTSDTNELQNLSEVLVQGDVANQSINMDNNSLNDVNSIDGGSDAVEVDSNLDTNGNSVTSSGGEMCLGDQCQ